jgi:hypothetical protein
MLDTVKELKIFEGFLAQEVTSRERMLAETKKRFDAVREIISQLDETPKKQKVSSGQEEPKKITEKTNKKIQKDRKPMPRTKPSCRERISKIMAENTTQLTTAEFLAKMPDMRAQTVRWTLWYMIGKGLITCDSDGKYSPAKSDQVREMP